MCFIKWLFYFGVIIIPVIIFALPKYELKNIDFDSLSPIKETVASVWLCKHIVYQEKSGQYYYKIWGLPENF